MFAFTKGAVAPTLSLFLCLAATAQDAPLRQAATNAAGIEFVLVPGNGAGDRPFYATKSDVTRGQWGLVMGGASGAGAPDRPMEGVRPKKAAEFCNRLGRTDGRGYRLPDAAERARMGVADWPGDRNAIPGGFRVVCPVDVLADPSTGEELLVHVFCDSAPSIAGFPPPPPYPPGAWWAGNEGVVVVEAIVGQDGRPLSVRAVEGSEALRGTAADYVRKWRFAPAVLDGRPVAAKLVLGLPFRLTRVVLMGDSYQEGTVVPSAVTGGRPTIIAGAGVVPSLPINSVKFVR